MKTKRLISIASLAALALLAAALPARAETVELVTNGKPRMSLDGWENTGRDNFKWYYNKEGEWFEADGDDGCLEQTVVLADKGITPEFIAARPTVTASVISHGGDSGTVHVTQLDADGRALSIHLVVAVEEKGGTKSHSIDFQLDPNARALKYELKVSYNASAWYYHLKFRECSLAIVKHEIAFVSDGKTIGTATCQKVSSVTPPAASRDGDNDHFLGYFTQTTGGERIFNENLEYVQGADSEWTPGDEPKLYAQWDSPRNYTFVSGGATVGSASGYADDPSFAAPIPTRAGGFTFLGYFTEDGRQVFDASGAPVQEGLSGLSQDVTLHALWRPPATSIPALDCSTIVYRGQLNLLTGGPATSDSAYVKRMHFRVYDGAEASIPLWKVDNVDVTVNADGSFVQAFGDETLAALIATGKVTHVGVAIGPSPALATELKPRRELRSVAAVNRALVADGAALDARVGNLVTENALVAGQATVSVLEVAGRVDASGGGGKVTVSPLVVGPEERTRLLRGGGVKVFADGNPTEYGPVKPAVRGQVLVDSVPSDGIALIASSDYGNRALRCPGVVQYCRQGESVRAPTSDAGGLKVFFFPFIGK